ncbi:MAG: porin [Gammaproteobacteria bacterium]|nr:porin [Gammaproteobacteria bacterium]
MNVRSLCGPSLAALLLTTAAHAAPPSLEDLWQLVQKQQQQIEALTAELAATRAALGETASRTEAAVARVDEVDAKVESTADALEQVATGDEALATTNVPQAPTSVGSAAGRWGPISNRRTAAAGRWADRTTLGGYGELHYTALNDNATAFDGAADDVNRADFHRFVLFASHTFNDWLRFASELEVEHALIGDGQPGEVALELAWLEMDLSQRHHLRAGIDILPVGLLNLTHEPNTFYGVERNPVESEIIPSTWSEATVGLWGELGGGFAYNVFLHSGLVVPTSGSNAFRPRSGRLKVAEADDQDAAVLTRVIYAGIPGLELAATFDYQADYTGTADRADADAWLFETHADWKHSSGFGLRALYARWELGRDRSAGVDPGVFDADTLQGWYIEPAYRFALGAVPGELGVFGRYQEWDERNQLGGAAFRYETMEMVTLGFNYWPHPQVVFKFDYQWQDADGPTDRELDGLNLGLGYQF